MGKQPESVEQEITASDIWELVTDIDTQAHTAAEDRPHTAHTAHEKVYVTDKNVSGQDIQFWLGWMPQIENGQLMDLRPMLGILYPDGTTDEYSLHPADRVYHNDRAGDIKRTSPLVMFTYLQQMEGAMTSGRSTVRVAVADKDHQ